MLTVSTSGARTPLSPLAQATLDKHLPNLSSKRLLQNVSSKKVIVTKKDVGCITEICNRENLPEVEIFSLLEEKIPKYRIRSDFLTNFTGYTNQDWFVPAPALPLPIEGLGLSKDQARETLNYFLLCSNRVSQMTRAYDDIEAVTRLLEEKEKDLELTVQIGKELLTQNNALENKIRDIEASLKLSNEDRAQLLHELHKKTQLIAVLTNDEDDVSENDTPTISKSITIDILQKKIAFLQEENKSLKVEASELVCETDEVEQKERKLMEDITMQLSSANCQFNSVSLELERHREENRFQHEQIVSLTARLSETEMRLHQLTEENDNHITLLNITKENQNSLAIELGEFKTRYQEVISLLQEAQDQLRKQRKKVQPQVRNSFMSSFGVVHHESLHSELMESSIYSENSLDSGISGDKSTDRTSSIISNVSGYVGIPPYKKVFETVRCATKNSNYSESMTYLGAMSLSNSSGPRISSMPYVKNSVKGNTDGSYCNTYTKISHFAQSCYEGASVDIKSISSYDSLAQSDDGYPTQPPGVPGVPGAKDLEAALKRLTPAEILAKRAMLSYAPAGTYTYEENPTVLPVGLRTPDSIMSTGSSSLFLTNISSYNHWRLPGKLQIIKPIEGSQTLHHWSMLATPTLSGLLEERPGVTIRGGRALDDLGMQIYSLSDVEEDIDELPGKQFEAAGCIYTFTNCTVMHPNDDFFSDLSFLSKSQMSSRMASASTSRQPSCPPTPKASLSRRNSCSTFSVNLGLASMLNERGIKAVTPSAINTPSGQNFSPTVTPCNSPEGSPTRSVSPEPLFGLLSSGADLIKRKFIGDVECSNFTQKNQQKIMLSRLEKRALRSLKLVEKVESIGLENIISTQQSAMSQLACGIASRSISPMAQLTSLKHITNSNGVPDVTQFNRDQLKGVLNKSLFEKTNQRIDVDPSVKTKTFLNSTTNTQSEIYLHNEANGAQASQTAGIRLKQIQRKKSRRNLKNGIAAQRPDLGTIEGCLRTDLGIVGTNYSTTATHCSNKISSVKNRNEYVKGSYENPQTITQSFVGSVSSLLFGRKGGWL